ncbi:MAG: hypothetical protein KBF42_01595 [Chitinophagales bacterium]|nr:hypothetical protein [Bacteroidota bacterium]MBK7569474.1 hypothetical protein [Bacteroidota bacterium]MBP8916469.1 hypothetical protein [Chitinophagales bacterium]MBP9220046.1 hypothetical protein [Chitinophagales bacterium]MBP9795582.1 hypothetical protein [Chitinophagales bacterium]
MKKLIFTFAICFISSLLMAATIPVSDEPSTNLNSSYIVQGDRVATTGTMLLKGDIWCIRSYDQDGIVDYVPLNLSKEFKVSGLNVKFAGTIKEVSDTKKLAGIPIYLIQIKTIPIR